MSSLLSTTLSHITDHFRPHRTEAIGRARLNGICLAALLVLSYLLPLPSLPSAILSALEGRSAQRWSSKWIYNATCIIESFLAVVFLFNLVEASLAIRYPRAPFPPLTSPARLKSMHQAPATPQRPFTTLSPNSSPLPQKPFVFSSGLFSLTGPTSSAYAPSPISTPSRVLHYSIPPSSSTNTQASSSSTLPHLVTPSPVVSAYRGKHSSGAVGHAFDGSYLGRMTAEESDAEE